MTDLFEALERLILAAERREYTIGDPINLITVKVELADAAKHARNELTKAKENYND